MTTWAISFVDTFLNELLNLPQSVQKKVSRVIKVLESDPISAQGDAKKLKGYSNNVYRVRIGDYRLFYSFGQGWVKLLSVRKRDDQTYEAEVPGFEPPAIPPNATLLNLQVAKTSEPATPFNASLGSSNPKNVVIPTSATGVTTALPLQLTDDLLKRWQIPSEYWDSILQVPNSEALLDLALPDRYLTRILDNLYPRSLEEVATQREYVLQTPEDLDRFVEGDLGAFLLKLDPEQEKLRDFGNAGPILVKGGPGTGKSTLALYRVKRLLEQGCKPILFTTYTKALVTYSKQLLEQLLGHAFDETEVKVTTVDSLTYQYYVQTYGKPRFAKEDQSLDCLKAVLNTTDIPGKNPFDRQFRRQSLERLGVAYLLQEIEDVIEAWGLSTLDEYLEIDRKGRKVGLNANLREALWAVYEAWRDQMLKQKLQTWGQVRIEALKIAAQKPHFPYQGIVIDEAQDLTPIALRFLLSLVPSFQAIYLTADASQSIYQKGFSWKQIHCDLKVTCRTLVLKRNYRNTQQISAACIQILDGTEAGDSECIHQEPSSHAGEKPSILLTDNGSQQIKGIHQFLVQAAQKFRLPLHGSAILCPNTQIGQEIAEQLVQSGLTAKFVSGDQIDINAPYIKVLTLHSAKGLEFPFVVVVGLREGRFPYIDPRLPEEEIDNIVAEQRRLFYVGCSRAMRALMICASKSQPSLFLNSLTAPHWQRYL